MKSGSVMLFFLVILGALVVLAALGFQAAVMVSMSARTRMACHQRVNLVEGLLIYGLELCKANSEFIISSICKNGRVAHYTFDPWPSKEAVEFLGYYRARVAIAGSHGIVTISAQLLQENRTVLAGQCRAILDNNKDTKYPLVVCSWSILHDEPTV